MHVRIHLLCLTVALGASTACGDSHERGRRSKASALTYVLGSSQASNCQDLRGVSVPLGRVQGPPLAGVVWISESQALVARAQMWSDVIVFDVKSGHANSIELPSQEHVLCADSIPSGGCVLGLQGGGVLRLDEAGSLADRYEVAERDVNWVASGDGYVLCFTEDRDLVAWSYSAGVIWRRPYKEWRWPSFDRKAGAVFVPWSEGAPAEVLDAKSGALLRSIRCPPNAGEVRFRGVLLGSGSVQWAGSVLFVGLDLDATPRQVDRGSDVEIARVIPSPEAGVALVITTRGIDRLNGDASLEALIKIEPVWRFHRLDPAQSVAMASGGARVLVADLMCGVYEISLR